MYNLITVHRPRSPLGVSDRTDVLQKKNTAPPDANLPSSALYYRVRIRLGFVREEAMFPRAQRQVTNETHISHTCRLQNAVRP